MCMDVTVCMSIIQLNINFCDRGLLGIWERGRGGEILYTERGKIEGEERERERERGGGEGEKAYTCQ